MIRGYGSSIIASFVVVLGTACTEVESNSADEPSGDDPGQLVDYVRTSGGAVQKSCTPEIESGAAAGGLVVTQPDGTTSPCEYPDQDVDENSVVQRAAVAEGPAISGPQNDVVLDSYTSVALANCELAVYSPSAGGRNGFAQLGCTNTDDLKLQVCLQQLVTGGWQTINWTCTTTHSESYYVDLHSGKVPYYTNNRWYRTWVWGYANGKTRAIVSGGFKG